MTMDPLPEDVSTLTARAAQTHDFRCCYWGHNLLSWRKPEGATAYTGLVICQQPVREGDTLIWATEYGHAKARVIESNWMSDREDMWSVQAEVVERITRDAVNRGERDA